MTAPTLQVLGGRGASIVATMTEIVPGAPHTPAGGAPPLPPGPVPAGYVPGHQAIGHPGGSPWTAGRDVALEQTQHRQPFGGPPLTASGVHPVDRREAWRWFLYALIGFVVGQLAAAIFGIVAGGIAGKTAAQMKAITAAQVPPEWYVVSTLMGIWIGFVGAPWLASRTAGTRRFLADLGIRFLAIDAVGIFIGVGGQIVVAVMYAPFRNHIHNFDGPAQKLTGSSHGGGFIVIALATVLVVPFIEEIFFRGLLLRALVRLCMPRVATAGVARTIGVVVAIVLDGLLFGLAHGELVQLAGLAVFGVVLAAISYRTGRLGMNVISHASFNLVAVIAILSQRGGVIH